MAKTYKPRNNRRRRNYRRSKTSFAKKVVQISKATALKEAETKRVYYTLNKIPFNSLESDNCHFTLLSQISQAGPGEASWENRRIGNSVQPCWLKGFLYLNNTHHGNYDATKNYAVRVLVLKDKENVISTTTNPTAFKFFRTEGQATPCTGTLLDTIRPIDWRGFKPMFDKTYKIYQSTSYSGNGSPPNVKVPISIDLTKCNFDFNRADNELVKENIAMYVMVRSFDGNSHSTLAFTLTSELTLSFKDL